MIGCIGINMFEGKIKEKADCKQYCIFIDMSMFNMGAQLLSGRVLDSRPKGCGFEPHRRHCVVSLSKNINPSLVLFEPRKTRPFKTERLLMGRKESNQTKQCSTSNVSLCTQCTCILVQLQFALFAYVPQKGRYTYMR